MKKMVEGDLLEVIKSVIKRPQEDCEAVFYELILKVTPYTLCPNCLERNIKGCELELVSDGILRSKNEGR